MRSKIFSIMFLIFFPILVYADSGDTILTIKTALFLEAFCSIHMSVFVLKPLAVIISQENSKKIFWILFIIRVCILLIFDFFVTTSIVFVDFFAIFIGAFLVIPICSIIRRKTGRLNQGTVVNHTINNILPNSISGIELKCSKCNSNLKMTDKFCPNCGEPFDGNNVIVSENVNSTIQVPPKVAVLPTNFDKMYSLTENKLLEEVINRELTNAGIDKSLKLIPQDIFKRKKIFNLIFLVLLFVFISLIFFHFPIYTYILGGILLFILFLFTRKYNLIRYLKKQIKARPGEKISNIVMNVKSTFATDNTKGLFLIGLIVAIILPLIIFSNPKILYEKTAGGYAVRYYIFGLNNFKTVKIPETYNNEKVVSLRGNTFSNMPFLESVQLPNSIIEIRGQAFKNCKNLVSVNIPTNLEYLGGGAFYGAKSIKNIELPDTLTYLGGESFYGARSLESIKLSENLTEIRGDSFEYCTSLKSITIPDNVTRIGGHAFYGDSSLSEVILTENSKLAEIGSSAFRKCLSLDSITIPINTDVNERAFKESPTDIRYFYGGINDYNIIFDDDSKNISIPYLSDYMLFNSESEILNIGKYNLRLHYYTGILDGYGIDEAYVSGSVDNPMYLSGKINIRIHFYDSSYNELLSHEDVIELLGKGYSSISFYSGVSVDELKENKTFNDIYYSRIEILQLSIN